MCYELKGNWSYGVAFDKHSLSSVPYINGNGQTRWNTTRTEMGELIYQLKYKNNFNVVDEIVDLLLSKFSKIGDYGAIIPVPPSKERIFQPVHEVASKLGENLKIPVLCDLLSKIKGCKELKGINNSNKKMFLLKNSMKISDNNNILETISNKNIILFDDLYDSGSTLIAATDLLNANTNVKNIDVLTLTKTKAGSYR